MTKSTFKEITVEDFSKELLGLIKSYNYELRMFIIMANAEKFSLEELNDLGYMEDKLDIYTEEN